MKKKFLINLGLLVIVNLLVKPFWVFGIEISVQNYVGSFEYGILFPLFNLSVILNIFLDLGINNFNNRAVSQNNALVYNYLPNIVVLKFLLAIIYSILVFGVAIWLGYGKRELILLSLLALNQFVNSVILYFRSNLAGLQHYSADSALSVLDRAIMIGICMVAFWNNFWGMPVSIEGFVVFQSVAYFIAAIIIGWVLFSKTGKIKFAISKKQMAEIAKSSLPFAALVFLMAIYSRIDAIMLGKLLPNGNYHAGIYAQSFRILDAAAMIGYLFAGLLLPMFSNLTGNRESVEPLTKTAFHLIWVISVAFSAACMLYAQNIIPALYHEGTETSSKVFSILILCFIPISIINIYGTLLTASGNLKILNLIAIFSIALNIILNLILIPSYYSIGAAITGLITQGAVAIAQSIVVKIKFGSFFISFKRVIAFSILSFLMALIITQIKIYWLVSFLITGGFIAITGLLLGLMPYKELVKYLQSNNSLKN